MPVAAGISLGWIGVIVAPPDHRGLGPLREPLLVAAGGIFYTLGAVVYAIQRPDFRPTVFGFHELFHVLTVLAAACQFAAVALLVA